MSLYEHIINIFYNSPLPTLITGIEIQLSREQFKEFIKEHHQTNGNWSMINWEEFDINKPIVFLVHNGRKLTINVKDI